MSAVKANDKDTYKATAVILTMIGMLYLTGKLMHPSALGIPWVTDKDNFLLYTTAVFLFIKRDKSVDSMLSGLWLVLNIGLIVSLFGSISSYLLPLASLIIRGILYLISTRWKEA